jgi:DNA-binding NarL/FixJ family response regulator
MQCKVLLCDDSEIFRKAVKRFLRDEKSVDLIGESSEFAQAVQMISDMQPDIVILDLNMVPPEALIEHTGNICNAKRLLVVSAARDQDSRDLADKMGADAFLDKMELAEKLIPTIVWLQAPRVDTRCVCNP